MVGEILGGCKVTYCPLNYLPNPIADYDSTWPIFFASPITNRRQYQARRGTKETIGDHKNILCPEVYHLLAEKALVNLNEGGAGA